MQELLWQCQYERTCSVIIRSSRPWFFLNIEARPSKKVGKHLEQANASCTCYRWIKLSHNNNNTNNNKKQTESNSANYNQTRKCNEPIPLFFFLWTVDDTGTATINQHFSSAASSRRFIQEVTCDLSVINFGVVKEGLPGLKSLFIFCLL